MKVTKEQSWHNDVGHDAFFILSLMQMNVFVFGK